MDLIYKEGLLLFLLRAVKAWDYISGPVVVGEEELRVHGCSHKRRKT